MMAQTNHSVDPTPWGEFRPEVAFKLLWPFSVVSENVCSRQERTAGCVVDVSLQVSMRHRSRPPAFAVVCLHVEVLDLHTVTERIQMTSVQEIIQTFDRGSIRPVDVGSSWPAARY